MTADIGKIDGVFDSAQVKLEQREQRRAIETAGESPWTVVYETWHDDDANGTWFAAFSPKRSRSQILSEVSWDIHTDDGAPGFVQYWDGQGRKRTKYLRFGNDSGIEPLVLIQDHHDMRPSMPPQLSEEFRLYHNLWVSNDGTKLYKIDMDGSDELVAEINDHKIRVRTKLLRQFQAAKQLDLVLYIDSVLFVSDPDESISPDQIGPVDDRENLRLSLHASDQGPYKERPFSRLYGKKVLPAPPRARAGVWPFDQRNETHPKFIIGEDANGDLIEHTCDPEVLADYFGKNPEAPNYMTPVFFRRDVLQRYYEYPEKYSVGDGRLHCGGLWMLRLDNDHPRHVMVFLGDLGEYLPESERPYWRTFNIPPSGVMSATVFKRSFLGEPAHPEAPDLQFKNFYERFKTKWKESRGWSLFKNPELADEHVLSRLRIPLNDGQSEFEDQVISLTKVLVDWLDEKEILKQIPKIADEKGISKLERWMQQENYPFSQRDIAFLRRLQRLRSRIVAHRKGSDYTKMLEDESVDKDPIREVVLMFWNANRFLRDLAQHGGIDLGGR